MLVKQTTMSSAVNLNAGFFEHGPNQKNTSFLPDTDDLRNVADDSMEVTQVEVSEDFDGESAMEDMESIDWEDADYE